VITDKKMLIALGGNALSREGEEGNLQQQYQRTRETMAELAAVLRSYDSPVVLTHGNGPQVGNILLRSEYSRTVIFPLTLDVCVSDSEGGMGYMIQQVLHNELAKIGVKKQVVTLITQVVVDPHEPAFANPTKFIGRAYTREEAEAQMRTSCLGVNSRGWVMKEDRGRGLPDGKAGWRRVVPSPRPLEIIETDVIKALLDAGTIVIAAGGGGIPVSRGPDNSLYGVDAVVDKDLASALLAVSLGIEVMVILTGVERVCLNFRQPNEQPLDQITAAEARRYLEEGHFPPGSMGPKIEAALFFLERGGEAVIITSPGNLNAGLQSRAGTIITT
jgi:carbamate kinase